MGQDRVRIDCALPPNKRFQPDAVIALRFGFAYLTRAAQAQR